MSDSSSGRRQEIGRRLEGNRTIPKCKTARASLGVCLSCRIEEINEYTLFQ